MKNPQRLFWVFLQQIVFHGFFFAGMCYGLYDAATQNTQAIREAIISVAQFNSSAAALQSAGSPYFTSILTAMAGASMTGANAHGDPRALLAAFATKLSTVYALPADAAVSLCRSIVASHCFLWFALSATCLWCWRNHPEYIIGKRSGAAAAASAAEGETAAAAAPSSGAHAKEE
jgi:hypothetical protein